MTFRADRVTIQTTKNTSDAAKAAFGVFCLTTVYPTDTTGAHGNSGGKSAGKDVFPSGNGRKCLKSSGNRYSQILWERNDAGSNYVVTTKKAQESTFLSLFLCLLPSIWGADSLTNGVFQFIIPSLILLSSSHKATLLLSYFSRSFAVG